MPRSIRGFSLNIFGDLWGGSLPLCWYECRIDILAYMCVGIKGIVMGVVILVDISLNWNIYLFFFFDAALILVGNMRA